MGDSNNAVRGNEGCLHDVHMLPANGIVQAEEVVMVARNLHWVHFIHGTPALMCNVVDDKDAAGKCQLVVLPVVDLHATQDHSVLA